MRVILDPAKLAVVDAMPARMAHALHGLLVASAEEKAPATAAEICVYDFDALSPRATGQALRRAAERGYCFLTQDLWWPTNAAHELRYALEDRALRDEDRR